MSRKSYFKLGVSILLPLLAGAVGSIFTSASISTWYNYLNKPVWNPPSWVFAPVWTILYIMMGISLFIIWNKGLSIKGTKKALVFFGVQLILNIAWSLIFFGAMNPFWALIEILALGLFIILTILKFYKISQPAALLLLPYLVWVTFAAYLNYTIWSLN